MTEITPAVITLGVIVKLKKGDLRGDFTKNACLVLRRGNLKKIARCQASGSFHQASGTFVAVSIISFTPDPDGRRPSGCRQPGARLGGCS